MISNLLELLDGIAERAPRLRDRGVRVVDIKSDVELRIEIDPAEPAIIAASNHDTREEQSDPLSDPSTYGRAGGVPGFDISDQDFDLPDE